MLQYYYYSTRESGQGNSKKTGILRKNSQASPLGGIPKNFLVTNIPSNGTSNLLFFVCFDHLRIFSQKWWSSKHNTISNEKYLRKLWTLAGRAQLLLLSEPIDRARR